MAAMTNKNDDAIENAEQIIERFGGIRPMASKMEVPVTTVQGWKKRNVIPGNRRDEVIEAAETNNIDLSDLIAGAANENSFGKEMAMAEKQDEEKEALHREAVLKAERTSARDVEATADKKDVAAINEAMLAEMHKAQSITFTKSAWFSVGLITLVGAIALMMLWPTKQQVDQNGRDIAQVKNDVSAVKKDSSVLRGLIPSDLEQRFGELQDQSRKVQETVMVLSEQANQVAKDMTDPNLSMGQRIEKIEEMAVNVGAPAKLTDMLGRIKQMQVAPEGQQLLSSAIAELNMIMAKPEASSEEGLEQLLAQAQAEDDALGETLQGVPQKDLKAAALLLGLTQFRSSLHRNAPFEEDLALMQKLLGEDDPELKAAITALAPKAESGVLSSEGLKSEFKGLAGDIVVSSLKGEDVSVQEKAKARFNELLSVEKDGQLITGTDTQATVARAQRMLDQGDVEGAIATLQTLEGDAAQTAQPFIEDAQVSMIAEQLQSMFTNKTISSMTGTGSMKLPSGISPDVQTLFNEIKNMAGPRHIVRDEASGFVILEPKTKILP